MERRDFLQKLGIALGVSALPISAIASTLSNEIVSDEVLNTKMKVYYFDMSYCGMGKSRYYLRKEEAYTSYLMNQGIAYTFYLQGKHQVYTRHTWDVLTAIQGAGYITKFCLPQYGGEHPNRFHKFDDSKIVEIEVSLDDFLSHNSKAGNNDKISGTIQEDYLVANK